MEEPKTKPRDQTEKLNKISKIAVEIGYLDSAYTKVFNLLQEEISNGGYDNTYNYKNLLLSYCYRKTSLTDELNSIVDEIEFDRKEK